MHDEGRIIIRNQALKKSSPPSSDMLLWGCGGTCSGYNEIKRKGLNKNKINHKNKNSI